MPELSPENIEQITRDIRNQEITFSHLADDLIDHVCCDVESEMNNGLDFREAYRKIRLKIGHRRLKEIQEETLYAIDTKYRYMKNTMKISGIAGTVLFGFAVLFKLQHWAGAGIMMTLGAFILAFVFMPSSLGVLWKETRSTGKLFLFISAFLAGMFFIIGILFKVQHWPGAGTILILAMLTGVLCLIPALLVNSHRINFFHGRNILQNTALAIGRSSDGFKHHTLLHLFIYVYVDHLEGGGLCQLAVPLYYNRISCHDYSRSNDKPQFAIFIRRRILPQPGSATGDVQFPLCK